MKGHMQFNIDSGRHLALDPTRIREGLNRSQDVDPKGLKLIDLGGLAYRFSNFD